MSLTIVVNGGGTFSASMEEGPVSFTASLGAVPGPKGDTGATGPTGVVAATAPIVYTSGTQTVSMDTAYFVRSPEVAATDGQILSWDADTLRPLWIANDARTLFLNGTNKTGTTIAKGKAVYVSGATGNHPEITLAQANSELSSARTIGITAEAIANNGTGKVIVAGALENVDTSAFVAGDALYLSSSTAGGFQTSLPTQPNHGVLMGYVVRSNASTGVIEVRVDNYQELGEQSDVLLTSKTNNDLLAYDSSSGLWKNKSFATLGLALSSDLSAYLLSSTAASTYAPIASPTFTGTVTIPAGASISGYLTTSTAASTYAPLASPTFTGTVTIPAGASISGFAPLASPAFTGNPTAPTPATSDNDTSIATTAFVNAYAPAASTTAAGKVELATPAETEANTSTSLAVTPNGIRHFYRHGWLFPDYSASTATTATGTTSVGVFGIRTAINSSASGQYAARYFGNASLTIPYSTSGSTINQFNWSKRVCIAFRFAVTGRSNVTLRYTFGKETGTGVGDLAARGLGIRIVGTGAVELQVHNGTTLTNVTSSVTPTSSTWYDCVVDSDGAGNVTLYVDGVSVATSTAGPTGNGGSLYYPVVWQENDASGSSGGNAFFWVNGHALLLD